MPHEGLDRCKSCVKCWLTTCLEMELAPLPTFPIPLSVARSFVHYPNFPPASLAAVTRSRSAPIEVSSGSSAYAVSGGHRNPPQKASRHLLRELSVDELAGIARTYGLGKLCCREDQQAAARLLPASTAVEAAKLRKVDKLLQELTWQQLIALLRSLARRRMGTAHTDAGSEYFEWVCNILLTSQLRDAALCGPVLGDSDSVMAWRMCRICAKHGLMPWWDTVQSRLGGGELVFLTCQPVPLLCDELTKVGQLVGNCQVASAHAHMSELKQLLQNCDVLYVGGKHDKSLSHLNQLEAANVTLAILNVCCSEKLAKHLIGKGVRHVAYWPTSVHDPEAVNFGLTFLHNLFEHRIVEAFHKARQVVSESERAPRLLSNEQVRERLCSMDVILEQHKASHSPTTCASKCRQGRSAYVGRHARVLSHTVMNGWVKVQIGDVITSWRVGHWREVAASAPAGKVMPAGSVPLQPACVNAAKLDNIPFADTQPDSEEDEEDAGASMHGAPEESKENFGSPSKALSQQVDLKVGDEVEDTQYFLRCMGANMAPEEGQVVECAATQVDDCEDTLSDVDSQGQGASGQVQSQHMLCASVHHETPLQEDNAKRRRKGTCSSTAPSFF